MKKIITVLFVLLSTEIECAFFCKEKDSELTVGVKVNLKEIKKGVKQSVAAFEEARRSIEQERKKTAARARLENSLRERAVRVKALEAEKKENAQRAKDVIKGLKLTKKTKSSSIEEETEPNEHDEQENWDNLYKKCAYGIIIAGGSYYLISAMSTYFSF